MTKLILPIFITAMLTMNFSNAQNDDADAVRQSIEVFFDGFHKQDSAIIKSVVSPEIRLQTMGTDREGNNRLRSDEFGQFIKSIVSIPDSINFKEEILDFKIQVDGPMAHAWTPYNFWINGERSHCGVNSFQLFHDGKGWKIIYLADTRRREGCE